MADDCEHEDRKTLTYSGAFCAECGVDHGFCDSCGEQVDTCEEWAAAFDSLRRRGGRPDIQVVPIGCPHDDPGFDDFCQMCGTKPGARSFSALVERSKGTWSDDAHRVYEAASEVFDREFRRTCGA